VDQSRGTADDGGGGGVAATADDIDDEGKPSAFTLPCAVRAVVRINPKAGVQWLILKQHLVERHWSSLAGMDVVERARWADDALDYTTVFSVTSHSLAS
jgi:hypothetical protein